MTVRETLDCQASIDLQLPDCKGSGSATRTFIIESSTALTEQTVLALGPGIGAKHPRLSGLYATSKSCKPTRKDLKAWQLTVNYQSVPANVQYEENPLARPPVVTWSSVSYEEEIYKDIAGKTILNSAGDYFDPPIRVARSRWQVSYKRNRAWIPTWILDYTDAINSDQFTIGGLTVPRGYAKLDRIEIGPMQIENGVTYYEVSYTFTLQKESWQPKILDQGLYEKVGGVRRRIRVSGEPVSEPVLLDGTGQALANPAPENAVYLTQYKAYRELPFATIL